MTKVKMNYGKNRKSILLSLMLIFCLTFTGMWLVYAGNNTNPSNPGSVKACTSNPWCFTDAYWGVRIALVDSDGNLHSGTKIVDIWYQEPKNHKGSAKLAFYSTQKNLKKFVHGNYTDGIKTDMTIYDYINSNSGTFYWTSTIKQFFSGFTLFNSFTDSRFNNSAPKLSSNIKAYDTYVSGLDMAKQSTEMDTLFSLLGYTSKWEDVVASGETNNLFLQFEPLIYVTVHNQADTDCYAIYGTVTEHSFINESSGVAHGLNRSYLGYVGAGIRIEGDYPKGYESTTVSYANIDGISSSLGQGVSHLWLNKFVTTSTCNDAVDNIKKYSKNIDADIISLVNNSYFFYKPDGTKDSTKKAQLSEYEKNYNGLKKEVYDKKGGPACKNYQDDPPKCEPKPDVKIDDCETGDTYFKDSKNEADWLVCGFAYTKEDGSKYSSDNTGHEAVETTNGSIVGNAEYCELFCYEEFETSFPTSVQNVKAGQTFIWGIEDGTFGSVKIKKHCSNQTYIKGKQGYRFEEWEADFKDNQKKQVQNYLEANFNDWANGEITTSSATNCSSCCLDWDEVCSTDEDGDEDCYDVCVECGEMWTAKKPSYGRGNSGNNSWMSASGSVDPSFSASVCNSEGAAKAAVTVSTSGYWSSYETAKNKEKPLLEKIRQCTNNIKYIYKTVVNFVFQEPVNGAYGSNSRSFEWNDLLEMTPNAEDGYNKNNVNLSTCKTKIVYSYNCNGSGTGANCTAIPEEVLDCTQVTWDIDGNYIYSYPVDDFQWFSDKRDSTLVNKKEKPSGDEAYFYSIGFGLPTAFSLTDGEYTMKVLVSNLGDNGTTKGKQDYNTVDGHFYPIANQITDASTPSGNGYGFEYECTYEVSNEIFGYDCQYSGNILTGNSPEYCDPSIDEESNGKLNVVDVAYRIVSLLSENDAITKAFPGFDGNGRKQGSNWDLGTAEIKNILKDDVYDSLAMYEIMLDVNAIQYIRKDNQKYFDQGKDPYTSYTTANNGKKVYCKSKGSDGEYKYCASEFLTDLQTSSSLNYKLMGTCLPSGMGTAARAQDVLDKGCYTKYTYPEINWKR